MSSPELSQTVDLTRARTGDVHITQTQTTVIAAPPSVDVELLLRGPINRLGLDNRFRSAMAALEAQPATAAGEFSQIRDVLVKAGCRSFAVALARQEADAWELAGQRREAWNVRAELVCDGVLGGNPWMALDQASKLQPLADDDPVRAAATAALLAYSEWPRNPGGCADRLRTAWSNLAIVAAGSSWVARVARWFAEIALVEERWEILQASVDHLRRVMDQATDAERVAIGLVLADISDDWSELEHAASCSELPAPTAGIVLCRYGYARVRHNRADVARRAYRQAIEKLGREPASEGDVSEVLYSLELLRWRCGPIVGPDPTDDYRSLANLLSRDGDGPASRGRRDVVRGIRGLAEEKLATAHENLRLALLAFRLGGHLRGVIESHSLLGDLYVRSNENALGVWHYVRAGESKKAGEAASRLEEAIDLGTELVSGPTWQVNATLAAIAAQGPLIPVPDATQLLPTILALTMHPPAEGLVSPPIAAQAYNAVAGLACQLTPVSVPGVLTSLEAVIARAQPNSYTLADEAVVTTLVRLHSTQPAWRDQVGALFIRCLDARDSVIRNHALRHAGSLARNDPMLLSGLRHLAGLGDPGVTGVLATSGDRHPAVRAHAQHIVAAFLQQPPRTGP
jgi:hypothetical protein